MGNGSCVVQSGVMVLNLPSPVCKSPMRGATAVSSATVLVNRLQNEHTLMLVRIRQNCSTKQVVSSIIMYDTVPFILYM